MWITSSTSSARVTTVSITGYLCDTRKAAVVVVVWKWLGNFCLPGWYLPDFSGNPSLLSTYYTRPMLSTCLIFSELIVEEENVVFSKLLRKLDNSPRMTDLKSCGSRKDIQVHLFQIILSHKTFVFLLWSFNLKKKNALLKFSRLPELKIEEWE